GRKAAGPCSLDFKPVFEEGQETSLGRRVRRYTHNIAILIAISAGNKGNLVKAALSECDRGLDGNGLTIHQWKRASSRTGICQNGFCWQATETLRVLGWRTRITTDSFREVLSPANSLGVRRMD